MTSLRLSIVAFLVSGGCADDHESKTIGTTHQNAHIAPGFWVSLGSDWRFCHPTRGCDPVTGTETMGTDCDVIAHDASYRCAGGCRFETPDGVLIGESTDGTDWIPSMSDGLIVLMPTTLGEIHVEGRIIATGDAWDGEIMDGGTLIVEAPTSIEIEVDDCGYADGRCDYNSTAALGDLAAHITIRAYRDGHKVGFVPDEIVSTQAMRCGFRYPGHPSLEEYECFVDSPFQPFTVEARWGNLSATATIQPANHPPAERAEPTLYP